MWSNINIQKGTLLSFPISLYLFFYTSWLSLLLSGSYTNNLDMCSTVDNIGMFWNLHGNTILTNLIIYEIKKCWHEPPKYFPLYFLSIHDSNSSDNILELFTYLNKRRHFLFLKVLIIEDIPYYLGYHLFFIQYTHTFIYKVIYNGSYIIIKSNYSCIEMIIQLSS